MSIILCIALAASIVYAISQKIACLTLSAYTVKKDMPPTDADLKECTAYMVTIWNV